MITRLLLWLSGVDHELLAKCTRLPQSERMRFAGFGGLVLISATIGFGSMTYAAYTFTQNLSLAAGFGTIWAAIVLWIDRFLAMTFHKSSVVQASSFWVAFAARLILAGVQCLHVNSLTPKHH